MFCVRQIIGERLPFNVEIESESRIGIERALSLSVESLKLNGLAVIRQFPLDKVVLWSFADALGCPLPNYENAGKTGAISVDQCLNIVRFSHKKPAFGFEREGAFLFHTARSWVCPPPQYFMMLMINKGDDAVSGAGRTLLLSWAKVIEWLHRNSSTAVFSSTISMLSNTDVTLPPNSVHEPAARAPIAFGGSTGDLFDLRVRYRSDLKELLIRQQDKIPDYLNYSRSIDRLQMAIENVGSSADFQLEVGDLLVIDNHRFAHGRTAVDRFRNDGTINPRELWSLSVQ